MICEELVGVAGARSGRAARWQHCCYLGLRVRSRFRTACPLAGECPVQRARPCKLSALMCHRRLQMACRCSVACVHVDAGGSGGFEGLPVMGAECASHSAARCRHVLEIGAASRDLCRVCFTLYPRTGQCIACGREYYNMSMLSARPRVHRYTE